MPKGKSKEPIAVKFVRSQYEPRAVLVDAELNLLSVEELRKWAARKVRFIVTDADTGEDITQVLMA